jgi:hypothetical protein
MIRRWNRMSKINFIEEVIVIIVIIIIAIIIITIIIIIIATKNKNIRGIIIINFREGSIRKIIDIKIKINTNKIKEPLIKSLNRLATTLISTSIN